MPTSQIGDSVRATQGIRIGEELNKYGTPWSVHICFGCGTTFTVTPSAKPKDEWGGCLAPECVTYDPRRDADRFFGPDAEPGARRI